MSEHERYKARMTELRRQHLRSGLLELYNRKIANAEEVARRGHRRRQERARLMAQPPREDDRLTATSIPSAMRVGAESSLILPDATTAAAIHARKLANHQRHEALRAESRRDDLHTLYTHARSFITTEAQLSAEIDLVFDQPQREWSTAASAGENIWNRDPPTTIAALLQDGGGGSAMAGRRVMTRDRLGAASAAVGGRHRQNQHSYRTDQDRMKRIAGVLSGGKI